METLQRKSTSIEGNTVVTHHSAGGGCGHPVVLLHGLSSSSRVFEALLAGPVGQRNELIAVDLPGHGASSNALVPAKVYTVDALANILVTVLQTLKVPNAVLVGEGLGGHVALQAAIKLESVVGVLAVGSPLKTGLQSEWISLAFAHDVPTLSGQLSASDAVALAKALFSPAPAPQWAGEAVQRTDPRCRGDILKTELSDDLEAVAKLNAQGRLFGLAYGALNEIISINYLASLDLKLWRDAIQVVPGGSACLSAQCPGPFAFMLRDFVNDAIRYVPHRDQDSVVTGVPTTTERANTRRVIAAKPAPATVAHPAARFEPYIEGHNEPKYRPDTLPTHSKYARGKVPAGQMSHVSMRFEGHADHEEEPAEPEQRGSGHRRFSLPGAMVHPELRYHSEIQEPVIQAPPVVDPSIATHPNRHGRVVPGTVPHVSSRFELTPEVVHEPVTSPTKQSDYHKQNPHARGKASGGQMAHPSARFQGVAATAGEMPSGPEETRLSTKVRAPPGGLSSFVFG